jgi:hypothetical protein
MSGTPRSIAQLEALFENGDTPTQQDFYDLFASFVHYLSVVSGTGTATDKVMSQKAVTDLVAAIDLNSILTTGNNAGSKQIKNLADPSTAQDADTKSARDAAISLAIANLLSSAPGTLDTLNELAQALGNDPNFAATITTALASKAPLASPALTGTPTAPTASPGDNSLIIANTAFVFAALSLKANVNNPAFTGVPTAATAANGTATTQLATCQFVVNAINDLIASAPGALNTLNELAAALGNDANFAATVTTALSQKAPLALTGFVSGAGVVGAADTVLQAIQKLDGNINAQVGLRKLVTQQGANSVLTTKTAAQNAAALLALVAAGSDGDTLYFPFGNYAFDPVAITKAIRLVGDGAIITLGTSNAPHWVFNKDFASVEGFTFIGQGRANATYPNQSAIKITGCSNVQVSKCTFDLMPFAGLITDTTHQSTTTALFGGISVFAVLFTRSKYGAYHTTRGEYVNASVVVAVDNDNAIYIGCGNVVYTGSLIVANINGIVLAAGVNDGHGIFAGCQINHNTNAVVATGLVLGFFFRSCNIYYGVLSHDTCKGIVYNDCTFEQNQFRFTLCTGCRITNSTLGTSTPTIDTAFNGGPSTVVLLNNRDLNGVLITAFNKTALFLPSYTVVTAPTNAQEGEMIYVIDDANGKVPAFFDGVDWRRVTDRGIITQTPKVAATVYGAILTKATSLGYTNPGATFQTAGTNFLDALISANILDYLDFLYLLATDGDSNMATLMWLNPNVKQLTKVNAPGFNNSGFNSNGTTSYLKTGFIPSVDGVQFRLNDCGIVIAGNMPNDANIALGVLNSGITGIDMQINSSNFSGRLNSSTQAIFAGDKRGNKLWALTRVNSSQVEGWDGATSLGVQTLNSTLLPPYDIYPLCRNTANVAGAFNNAGNKLGLVLGGRGTVIKSGMGAINTAWNAYKTATGI